MPTPKHSDHKKLLFICLSICVGIFFIISSILGGKLLYNKFYDKFRIDYVATDTPPTILEDSFSSANNFQTHSIFHLIPYDGSLIIFCTNSRNQQLGGTIFRLSNGELQPILEVKNVMYLGTTNGFIYYVVGYEIGDELMDVYCYSLKTGSESFLLSVAAFSKTDLYFEENTIFIPNADTETGKISSYYLAVGTNVTENFDYSPGYKVGSSTYIVRPDFAKDTMYRIVNGEEEEFEINSKASANERMLLYPVDNGLLVRYSVSCNMLYLINEESGTEQLLFSVPGMEASNAFNVYGDYVFLSFKRYEKPSESGKGLARFENDTLEGTYRIDLRDGSATKISDNIYNGLFIFGEGVIYVTDEDGQIFQLDFDGNIMQEILTLN